MLDFQSWDFWKHFLKKELAVFTSSPWLRLTLEKCKIACFKS